MEDKKYLLRVLEHLRKTGQYFCFTGNGQLLTAEELLTKLRGHQVSYGEAVRYLTGKRVKV